MLIRKSLFNQLGGEVEYVFHFEWYEKFYTITYTGVCHSVTIVSIILETINAIKTIQDFVLVSLTRHILLLAFDERQLNSNKSKCLKCKPF